jgi:hypothetical protein
VIPYTPQPPPPPPGTGSPSLYGLKPKGGF